MIAKEIGPYQWLCKGTDVNNNDAVSFWMQKTKVATCRKTTEGGRVDGVAENAAL
jgi:hypothetical protein